MPQGISVSTDKTKQQRKQLKVLRDEASCFNVKSTWTKKIIKHTDGNPMPIEVA